MSLLASTRRPLTGPLLQLLPAAFLLLTPTGPTSSPWCYFRTATTCNRCPTSLGGVRAISTVVASAQQQQQGEENLHFGPYKLDPAQVFYRSQHCLGIVNLKPIVPGHVLVIPKRVVPRMAELSTQEVSDLFRSVHHLGPVLEKHYGGEALTVSMQDGAAAGQSVPHVHVHVLPRKAGDFKRNDQVYEELDGQCLDRQLDLDEERRPRSKEEMAHEARQLRALFPHNQPSQP